MPHLELLDLASANEDILYAAFVSIQLLAHMGSTDPFSGCQEGRLHNEVHPLISQCRKSG